MELEIAVHLEQPKKMISWWLNADDASNGHAG